MVRTEIAFSSRQGGGVGVDDGGRSVWSERESESVPLRKGTDTVYSELQNSSQGVADNSGYGSVEYAQLNHDLPEPV
ncbi:hypothetical protein JZ751_026744 [Albula glossodonta]|uniref:Uncharacterized protein n=1 Tax=Albula glossodonta TaxID=121402 RepID=A0A8T2PCY6_9TELE|nr:hypothetical protein JZ751_026744 [Albula glossodonta]